MSDKNHLNFAQKSNCGEQLHEKREDVHLLKERLDIIISVSNVLKFKGVYIIILYYCNLHDSFSKIYHYFRFLYFFVISFLRYSIKTFLRKISNELN